MVMTATVIRVNGNTMLVRDDATGQEVLVNFRNNGRFWGGERVRITYTGTMSFSIPPQITATSVQRIDGPAPAPAPAPSPAPARPSEIRATVLQTGRNSLLVRNNRTGQQMRVSYPFAYHFCARQQITVRYDTITLTNPPQVTATDIIPIC